MYISVVFMLDGTARRGGTIIRIVIGGFIEDSSWR